MKITTDLLKTFKPCQDRLDNWIEHYGDKKPSLRKFTQLVNITYNDKIWVLIRLLSEENKVIFAIDMAVSAAQHSDAASSYAADAIDAAAYYTASYAAFDAASIYAAYAAADAFDAAYAAYADALDAVCAASAYAAAINSDAASAAFDAAAHATDRIKEKQEQLEILIYLIESQEK